MEDETKRHKGFSDPGCRLTECATFREDSRSTDELGKAENNTHVRPLNDWQVCGGER